MNRYFWDFMVLDRSRIERYAVRHFSSKGSMEMPIENLIVMTLSDIDQVQIECQCGAAFTYDPDRLVRLPDACHQCSANWKDGNATFDRKVIQDFIEAMPNIRKQQMANPRLKIKLVFREHEANES